MTRVRGPGTVWVTFPSAPMSPLRGIQGPIRPAPWLPQQAQLATDPKEALPTPPPLHILSLICRPEPWPLTCSLWTLPSLLNGELCGLPGFHSKNLAKQTGSGHWK